MNDIRPWPRNPHTPTGRFVIPTGCNCSTCAPPLPWRKLAIIGAALAGCLLLSLSGCATAKTCSLPVTAQVISDGAAVLVCANTGKTLAACEDAQLAIEAGQLTADLLACGEQAVAAAATQPHTNAADAGK